MITLSDYMSFGGWDGMGHNLYAYSFNRVGHSYLNPSTGRNHVERVPRVLYGAQVSARQHGRDREHQEHDDGSPQSLHADHDERRGIVHRHHLLFEDVLAALFVGGDCFIYVGKCINIYIYKCISILSGTYIGGLGRRYFG